LKQNNLLLFIGNVIYHFDRALFNLLIPFLAPVFFKNTDPVYALIAMFMISPLTIFVKPLGAIFFGFLEKKISRVRVLSITLLGMSLKTFLMAFLPTYDQIGYFAPVLLAFIRMGISFFSGSETAGGSILLFERSNKNFRNFFSSLFDISGILGVLMASFSIYFSCEKENFWRLLFLIGGLIGLVGWYFRKLPDTSINDVKNDSIFKIIFENKKIVFLISIVSGFSYANYYLITSFMNSYIPIICDISNKTAISINNYLLIFDVIFLLFFGYLSLKIKKESLMFFGIIGILISSIPLFMMLEKPTFLNTIFLRVGLTFFGCAIAAPYHAWVYEKTQNNKLLIASFSTSIGSRLLGSSISFVSLWLYKKTNLVFAPGIILFSLSVFSMSIFLFFNNTKALVKKI